IVYLVGAETVGFTLMMTGVPYLLAAWAGWLLVTQFLSWPVRRAGLFVAVVLALGYCALIRWDGLSGQFQETTNWRWVPTLENKYLSYRATHSATAPAPLAQASPVVLRPGD